MFLDGQIDHYKNAIHDKGTYLEFIRLSNSVDYAFCLHYKNCNNNCLSK